MSKIIYLEGPKGSGKSTLAKALEVDLTKAGFTVHSRREPGGTSFSERIRDLLKSTEPRSKECEMLLLQAARLELYKGFIEPMSNGDDETVFLIDRSIISSMVTQYAIRGLEFVPELHKLTNSGYIADMCFWLLPEKDVIKERIHTRDSNYDILNPTELMDREYDTYKEMYEYMAVNDDGCFAKKHFVMDSAKLEENVHHCGNIIHYGG